MKLSNLRIGTRLMGIFAIVLALSTLVGIFAIAQMGAINGQTHEIATTWAPSVSVVGRMQNTNGWYRRMEMQHVMSSTREDMEKWGRRREEARAQLEKLEKEYLPLITSPEERALYDAFKGKQKEFHALGERLMDMSSRGDELHKETLAFLRGPTLDAFNATDKALEALVEFNARGAAAAAADAQAKFERARTVVVGLLMAAVVVAALLALWITRQITGSLGRAVEVADRIAQGDLSARPDTTGKDEVAKLQQSLAAMVENLRRVVTGVRADAESVATASKEIADGNLDLSARTEQQASSLQETASSMEQLTSAVKQNAENARQGNQLAQSASTVALQGGEVVEQVVTTMKDIEDSSRRIADIIAVIDGIAFQTNILALNAAVEAARAGEQGRGFAVVASEVRSLAQRSAEAAREIKALITASVDRVGSGTALVAQAGHTMHEIVASIRRVTDLMGEISAASQEQSTGIGQVNDAVTQMDQVIQQNAALVEEASAATASLREQSGRLVEAVSVFRLD